MKRNKMKGVYNALHYHIFLNEELVYAAGNNPMSSATNDTVPASLGVGLECMKEYCAQTLREMCLENNGAINEGIQYKNELETT